eukprot:1133884-Rhodomonas_salina.1
MAVEGLYIQAQALSALQRTEEARECERRAVEAQLRLSEQVRAAGGGDEKRNCIDMEQVNARLLEQANDLISQGKNHAGDEEWTPARVALSRAINRLRSCSLYDCERITLLVSARNARAEVLLQSEERGLSVLGRDGGEAIKDIDSAEMELKEAVAKGCIAGRQHEELQERLCAAGSRARKVMEALWQREGVQGQGTGSAQKCKAKKVAGIRVAAHGKAALAKGLKNDDECPVCLEDWCTPFLLWPDPAASSDSGIFVMCLAGVMCLALGGAVPDFEVRFVLGQDAYRPPRNGAGVWAWHLPDVRAQLGRRVSARVP